LYCIKQFNLEYGGAWGGDVNRIKIRENLEEWIGFNASYAFTDGVSAVCLLEQQPHIKEKAVSIYDLFDANLSCLATPTIKSSNFFISCLRGVAFL